MKQITAVFLAILAPILLASEGMTEEMESDSSPIFSQSDIQPSGTILLTPQSDNQPSSYILGHGDRVVVDIFGLPDYSQEYGVLADGTLNLPLVGSIYVQGLTLTQASQEIEERYQAFVRRPVVTLDVQRPRPLQIAVVGEVNRPGTYSFATVERAAQGDRDQRINVTAAISQAGGITQLADVRNVQVYRPEPYRGGNGEYISANLWDLLRQGDLSQDLTLRDGDTIIVPEASLIDDAEITEVASANFSPDTIDVYVVGEVDDPGVVQIKPNTPLNQALLAAGGFDLIRASRGTVRLVRLNPDGTVSDRSIAVDFAASVNDQTNPAMRPNDTILVGRSALTSVTDTLEQIFNPLRGVFDFVRIIGVDDN